jgi:opacity protein-like surface antigen
VPGLELLPEIGRVGAQVGFNLGRAYHPFEAGDGFHGAGFIDLPLAQGVGGRLSYRISVGLGESTGEPFVITNPIAYVANLAAGFTPADAFSGPPRAPFPVRRAVRTRLRVLTVSPFALKHTFTGLDRARLRPYLTAGVDAVVVISKQVPERDESLAFTGTSPFDDELIAGLVAQAPELAAQGLPTGQGNLEFGYHAGGGLELRLSRGVSLNLDYRLTRLGGGESLHAAGGGLGIHW